ncbi:MAG: CHAT domain-containing protein [Bacteroidales bacterium]
MTKKLKFLLLLLLPLWGYAQTLHPQVPNQIVNGQREGKWVTWFTDELEETDISDSVEYYMVCTYKQGRMEGEFTFYYLSGQKFWAGNAIHDKISGTQVWYYNNGKKKVKQEFKNDVPWGKIETFYENGKTELKGNFKDGHEDGLFIYYHPNGKVEKKSNFQNGKKEGVEEHFNESGRLASRIFYVNDEYQGECFWYYESGKLFEKQTYDKGLLNGWSIEYYENGQIKSKVNYIDNNEEGVYTAYYESGEIEEIKNFSGGYLNGEHKMFYENGNKKLVAFYKDGELEGEFVKYYENGQIETLKNYIAGNIVGNSFGYFEDGTISHYAFYDTEGQIQGYEIEFYESGDTLSKKYYIDGVAQGTCMSWYPNGNIEAQFSYENGLAQGKFISFYEDGTKDVEGTLVDDEREGEWLVYRENGTLLKKINFKNGLVHGLETTYFENGKINVIGNYEEDVQTGEWKWYYESGALETVGFYKNDQKDGKALNYYEDGTLKSRIFFKEDERRGIEERFYPNGNIEHYVVNYEDNPFVGESAFFREDGSLIGRTLITPAPEEVRWQELNTQMTELSDVGLYEEAVSKGNEALNYVKDTLSVYHSFYGATLNNLGLMYKTMGAYEKALPLFLEVYEFVKRTLSPASQNYVTTLSNLAGLYTSLGQYEKAKELYDTASLRFDKEDSNSIEYGILLNNIASFYFAQKKYEEALTYLVKIIDIGNSIEKDNSSMYINLYIEVHNKKAIIYEQLGDYEKALEAIREAIKTGETNLGKKHVAYLKSLDILTMIYSAMGNYSEAIKTNTQSIEITKEILGKENFEYTNRISNQALLYKFSRQNVLAVKSFSDVFSQWLFNVNNSFAVMTESEKENFIQSRSNFIYERNFYTHIYPETPEVSDNFYNIELATKGIVLNSNIDLTRRIQNTQDADLIDWFGEYKEYKHNIAQEFSKPVEKRNTELKQWIKEAETLESKINRKVNLTGSVGKITWKDIREGLQENEVAIEFSAYEYRSGWLGSDTVQYVALIIRKGDQHPVLVPLFTQKQLDELTTTNGSEMDLVNNLYRGAVASSTTRQADLNQLYNLLWKPLEEYLQEGQTIYFAPSGTLHQIAFSAIRTPEGNYLSDKYILKQVSTTAKILDKEEKQSLNCITLFGGIEYDLNEKDWKKESKSYENKEFVSRSLTPDLQRGGEIWSYLAGTLTETESINILAQKAKIKTQFYSGNNALEESFKSLNGNASPSILHIATHGFFFPDPEKKKEELERMELMQQEQNVFKLSDNPLNRAGLLFAGANHTWKGEPTPESTEDGILTAYEASQVFLPNTELVVLSACETGLGEIKGSEGVFGLQRAFKAAGAKYLLMSLWKVPDKETAEFMEAFYQELFESQDIESSYIKAQNQMKTRYPNNPYSWAAFVLVR